MSDDRKPMPVWAVLLIVALALLPIGRCTYLMATCDGHVVRNFMDWPVCVK